MRYHEKSSGEIRFKGALWVADTLKILAVITVIGGFIYGIQGAIEMSDIDGGDVAEFLGWAFAGTAGAAAFLAFLGYTLEILIGIWENTWSALDDDDEVDEEFPSRVMT